MNIFKTKLDTFQSNIETPSPIAYDPNDNSKSNYYLFFSPTKYTHKYIIIDYKKEDEREICDKINLAIQTVKEQDPQIVYFKEAKYN